MLSAAAARALDAELFRLFPLQQLMELAGLSVASAVSAYYPRARTVGLVVGSGNNCGDGLVAARHLRAFGYSPSVWLLRAPPEDSYNANLVEQLKLSSVPVSTSPLPANLDLYVDAILGFSATGPIREPASQGLQFLLSVKAPVVSIDVPSGWEVDSSDPPPPGSLQPDLLVSLTCPKICAHKQFKGKHVLGLRSLPASLLEKHNVPDFWERAGKADLFVTLGGGNEPRMYRKSQRLNVVLLGSCGAGKTCLVRRYCEGSFAESCPPTAGADFGAHVAGTCGSGRQSINFFDLSGAALYAPVRADFYKDAHALLLVFDASDAQSLGALSAFLREAQRGGLPEHAALAVCGCKADVTPESGLVSRARQWCEQHGASLHFASAKSGEGVEPLFGELLENAGKTE
jgi:NAD(P)H-hydrate epimerase